MKCSFQGCKKEAKAVGLCPGHRRQQKAGEPLRTLQVQYHGLNEYQRLFKRIVVGKRDECWPWTGSVMKEGWHGQWRTASGEIEPTHRAAWRLMKGEIPEGLCVLHKCDNPICLNPLHLFLGTQSDNALDMWEKRRARPGVSKGEQHGCAKITVDIVREIRESKESGVALAARFGLATTTICDVRKRRTWKHIV
jgi:hypothetical protein